MEKANDIQDENKSLKSSCLWPWWRGNLLEYLSAGNTPPALIWRKFPGWNLVEAALSTHGASLDLSCQLQLTVDSTCFLGFSACVASWDAPRGKDRASYAKHLGRCSCLFIQNDTGPVGPWVHPPLFQTQGWQKTSGSWVNQMGRTSWGSEGQQKSRLPGHLARPDGAGQLPQDTRHSAPWEMEPGAPQLQPPSRKQVEGSSTFVWAYGGQGLHHRDPWLTKRPSLRSLQCPWVQQPPKQREKKTGSALPGNPKITRKREVANRKEE